MNFTNLRKMVGGTALTLAMLAGIGVATSGTAQAQFPRNDDRYYGQRQWDRNRVEQFALMLGYHNAYTEGKEAADRGRRLNFRDMPGYRNSDNGYKTWMGHDDTYRSSYRRGYEAGFRDGQERRGRRYDRNDIEQVLGDSLKNVYGDDRYDRWDDDRGNGRWDDRGNGRWDDRNDRNQIIRMAQQNGYTDGMRRGREDRSRRRGNEASRESEYRDGMRGYRSEYGNRDVYRQAYREGFIRGYEEGYRGGNNGPRFPF